MTAAAKILYVEDNVKDYELFSHMLMESSDGRMHVSGVPRLSEALNRLGEQAYKAVLLDLNLLDVSGPQSVRILNNTYPDLPIVVFTGSEEERLEEDVFACGAQEYLIKGQLNGQQLRHSILQSIRRKKMEAEFFYRSHFDPATHLPNPLLFEEHLRQSFHRARRYTTRPGLILAEIQNYSTILSTFGAEQNAGMLASFANSLRLLLRQSDILARWDEQSFALLLDHTENMTQFYRVARRISTMLQQPVMLCGGRVHIDLTIGGALLGAQATHPGELVIAAKGALYEAREHYSGVYLFDPDAPLQD